MDEEAFNLSVRRFLKKLGVTSQREIELGVRELLDAGKLSGSETLEARAVVTVEGLEREIVVTGEIVLAGEPSGSPEQRLLAARVLAVALDDDDLVVLVEPDIDGLAVLARDLDLPGGAVLAVAAPPS